MNAQEPRTAICANCGDEFVQPFGRGKSRKYCTPKCAPSRGQRRHDDADEGEWQEWTRRLVFGLGRQIRQLEQQMAGGGPDHELMLVLVRIKRLRQQLELLTGVAVCLTRSQAPYGTAGWGQVGDALGVSRQTASTNWKPEKVRRRMYNQYYAEGGGGLLPRLPAPEPDDRARHPGAGATGRPPAEAASTPGLEPPPAPISWPDDLAGLLPPGPWSEFLVGLIPEPRHPGDDDQAPLL